MKTEKYLVKLLTQNGIKEIVITEGEDLKAVEIQTRATYGDFVTLSTTPL